LALTCWRSLLGSAVALLDVLVLDVDVLLVVAVPTLDGMDEFTIGQIQDLAGQAFRTGDPDGRWHPHAECPKCAATGPVMKSEEHAHVVVFVECGHDFRIPESLR
jgi:hypothetical protein